MAKGIRELNSRGRREFQRCRTPHRVRGSAESLSDAANFFARDFARLRIILLKFDGARREDVRPAAILRRDCALLCRPGTIGAGFASGVGKLNARDAALFVNEVDNTGKSFGVAIAPNAKVLRTDARFSQNGGGFAKNDRGASYGTAAKMDEVPIAGEAVFARILAHGRNGDAIAERDCANRERLK